MGHIGESQFIYGISKLNLDLSIFEINQIMYIVKLTKFDRLRRSDFKNKFKSLIKKYNINPLQNFSISLLARIKNLIQNKNRNLLESFYDEDPYKTGYADIDMLKKALMKFGIHNIRLHEIKTLLKIFFKDVNMQQEILKYRKNKQGKFKDIQNAPVNTLDEYQSEIRNKHRALQNNIENDSFGESDSSDKDSVWSGKGGLNLGDKTMSLEEADDFNYNKKKEKRYNIENPNFKVSYKDFCERIYEEIENNSKLAIESSFEILRKVFTL